MSKLAIILGLLAAFVILKHLIRNSSRGKTKSETQTNSDHPNKLDQAANYKDTVQCQYCGTHIPLSTAFKSGNEYYCDESHFQKSKS